MFKKVLLIFSAVILFAAGVFAQEGSAAAPKEASASTSDAPKAPARFVPSKDQIKKGQMFLISKKLYSGEATGKYDDETRAAIRVYQKDNKLTLTGNFNRATLEKMNIALTDKQKGISTSKTTSSDSKTTASTSSESDGPKRPAVFRANAEQIKAAQKLLKAAKMYSGEETGKFDEDFRDGLGKFQEAKGLKVTRTLNAITLGKMGIDLTEGQKATVAAQKAYDAGKDKEKDSE